MLLESLGQRGGIYFQTAGLMQAHLNSHMAWDPTSDANFCCKEPLSLMEYFLFFFCAKVKRKGENHCGNQHITYSDTTVNNAS